MSLFQSDMNNEFKRYATFSGFHSPDGVSVWPLQLAQAGFYRSATCQEFQVVCFACGLVLDLRTPTKEPMMETHRRLAPSCSFVAGSSDNQPVPPVDPGAALDWLSQNFAFDSLQDVDTAQHSYILPNVERSAESVYAGPVSLPENFTLSEIIPHLPNLSDLSTLEQTGLTSQQANLSTLPSDLLSGFANTMLNSVPTGELFQAGSYSPAPQLFGSNLGGLGEILVTDGISAGVEGSYPASMMPASEISNYTAMTKSPVDAGELGKVDNRQKISISDLGIITDRPKRQEFATIQKRLNTFKNWMGPIISQSNELIAEAGFYYAGYADCCRCFYCGGGLKSWEPNDDPWVEHARWFETCPFVLVNKGRDFIQAVQSLARTNCVICMSDVETELNHIKSSANDDVIQTDDLEMDTQFTETDHMTNEVERLANENQMLKQPELCKICLDREVGVIYLPCGHLVTCGTCASTVQTCPMCRQDIHGQVRIQRTD